MTSRLTVLFSTVALCVMSLACEKASPTRPTAVDSVSLDAESLTDARTGTTLIAARPQAPANGAEIRHLDQPITVSVRNGITTGSSALSYTFEVARDAGFSDVVFTRGEVPAGNGTTSVTLARLAGSTTYHWRVRMSSGTGAGPTSATRSFVVGPEIVLGTPTLLSPLDGMRVSSPVALTVRNLDRSGPAGEITYVIQVAADAGFQSIAYSTDVTEQAGERTQVLASIPNLADGASYFWRATALDRANAISTPPSATGVFVGQTGGVSWESLGGVTIVGPSPDVSGFAVTSRITTIHFSPGVLRVDHDQRGRWRPVDIGAGALQEATLWLFFNINGRWHTTGSERFRPNQTEKSLSAPSALTRGWFYLPVWAPIAGYQPRVGEQVGFMMVAGSTRLDNRVRDRERTSITMIPWPADGTWVTYP